MKLKTIKLFMAVLCVLLFGVSNAMAGTLKVAKDGLAWTYNTYDSNVSDIRLPNQCTIDGESNGTLSYDSNAHQLTFNNVHRTSSAAIYNDFYNDGTGTHDNNLFAYEGTLTIKLVGENELTVAQTRQAVAHLFSGNVNIVGSGSLKINLQAPSITYSFKFAHSVNMQGTGVVEISLLNADSRNTPTYVAKDIQLQEGMMLSTRRDIPSSSTTEYDMINSVHRKNGGLSFSTSADEYSPIWIRIEPLKKYNLYIAGQQVNWINMTDVLGDGGSVSYDPTFVNSGGGKGQITLKNADIHYEYNGSGDKTSIFEHSDQNDPTNHVAGVYAASIGVKLIGRNKITGVVNSPLDSKTPFVGFPEIVRLYGSGTLRMELSANAAAEGGVYTFGSLNSYNTNSVVLNDSFTGWVSVSTSNVDANPASVFRNSARVLCLPDNSTYTDYFIASSNTLPVKARTIKSNVQKYKDLDVAHVNFGKKDGSADPTGTITRPLIQMAYVGKTLADNTLGLEVTGGQGPFYYSATGLQDGLSINPENGCVSGTYTTANTPASGAQTTFTVTDFQGRQTTVSANRQEVVEKLTINDSDSEILTLKPKWAEGVAIEQIKLSDKISGGKAPYTYYALSATLNQGRTTLPTGVSFDKSTGVISGTPTERMEYNYGIVVEDYVGQKVLFNVQGNVAENYGFMVAGVPVTDLNKDNIPVSGKTSGTISYDPATETLVFDNVEIYTTSASTSYFVDSKISKIKAVGKNIISYIGKINDVDEYYGFPGDLEIYGDGDFRFRSGRVGPNSYAVNGNVTIMDNATIMLASYYAAINGTLTIPMNQVIYTGNSTGTSVSEWNKLNGISENMQNYLYKYVKTEILANGALCFTNKKEGKTIYNTVPLKPFAMFDVMGGEAPYSYSATSLPSGLTIDAATGYISGTSSLGNKDVTVTFTVTDAMGREINTDMNLTVKNPSLAATKYGGSKPGYGETGSWTTIVSTSLDEGQILFVKSNFDLDETAIEVPKNIVLRDVNGKMLAGDIDLKDGVKYAFPYDVEAKSISYTRNFSATQKDKWQALYIPFAFNVADYAEDFDVAEIYAVCPTKDTNGDGVVDADDDKMMILSFVKNGKTQANAPYMIRPKKATAIKIESENELLHNVAINSVEFSTSRTKYTVNGIYSTFDAKPGDHNFYMSGGKFSWATTAKIAVSPNRWYMHEESKSYIGNDANIGSESKPIGIHVIGEDFDEATAIRIVNAEFNSSNSNTGIYNLNGLKMNETGKLPRGIYIKNGKKVIRK